MRPLNVRFRHDVICPYSDCSERICAEGDITAALHPDGSPVTFTGFDATNPHAFEIACSKKHVTALHFPKDLVVIRTPADDEGLLKRPPAVLRV